MAALPPRMRESLEGIASVLASRGGPGFGDGDGDVARIPVACYTSPSVRETEVDRLFRPLPLIVGHASELPR
jgi:hypothetical protein